MFLVVMMRNTIVKVDTFVLESVHGRTVFTTGNTYEETNEQF